MSDLLPPNSTALERRVASALAAATDLDVRIRAIWDPASCPLELLPWLAWAFSVDDWNPDWGEDTKRAMIAESINVHRRKGTVGSVRRALAVLFADGGFTLVEGASAGIHNGISLHDGSKYYGQAEHWAKYSVYINRPISQAQAADVRAILASIAPARCQLHALNFQQALNAYNGAIKYDNTFTHGVA